jgi:ankyrin repeat protein
MVAAAYGNRPVLEIMLERGADITAMDQNQNTVLHYACAFDDEESALVLLDREETTSIINMANKEGRTALHLAAKNGLVGAVRKLIDGGASVAAVDENGHTPALSCAATNRVAECLALILSNMMPMAANPYTVRNPNGTRIEFASKIGKALSDSSLNTDCKDYAASQSSDSEFY